MSFHWPDPASLYMASFLGSLSLKTRVVLLVVALLVAGVWGLALRVSAVLQTNLEAQLSEELSATVRFVAENMDRDVELRFEALKRIGAALDPAILADSAEIQTYLEARQMVRAIFGMNLMVVDKNGVIVADYPLVSGRLGYSLKDRPYFRDVMATGQPLIGAPVTGALSGRAFIPMSVPLRDASGAVVGVLVDRVVISEAHPFGQLQDVKTGRKGYFLVISPDQKIISATDGSRIMTQLPLSPLLERRLRQGYEGPGVTVTSLGAEVLSVSRRMATTGWIVLAAAPTAEIFEPITILKRQIYLAALLITFVIAMILRIFVARFSARLDRFGEAMRRMTEGEDPLATIPVTERDEVGRVEENFNRLVMQRNRLDEALREEISVRKQAQEALNRAMMRLQLLSERATRTYEEERHEIASELHEQLGQDLTTLNLHLHMLKAQCTHAQANEGLQSAHAIAGTMLERVRNMAIDLRPPLLDDFGLYAALRAYCAKQAKISGWQMHFEGEESAARPHRDVEIACFRLVQEALANVAQHANATEVWVSVERGAEEFRLTVRDNGAGFDAAAIHEQVDYESLGLISIEERVRQVSGRLEVQSASGKGTEIRAIFRLCSSFPDELCHPADNSSCTDCHVMRAVH